MQEIIKPCECLFTWQVLLALPHFSIHGSQKSSRGYYYRDDQATHVGESHAVWGCAALTQVGERWTARAEMGPINAEYLELKYLILLHDLIYFFSLYL